MTLAQLQHRWQQLKGAARRRWSRLSEDDLDRIGGDPERLVQCLRERYGYPRALVIAELGHFLAEQR